MCAGCAPRTGRSIWDAGGPRGIFSGFLAQFETRLASRAGYARAWFGHAPPQPANATCKHAGRRRKQETAQETGNRVPDKTAGTAGHLGGRGQTVARVGGGAPLASQLYRSLQLALMDEPGSLQVSI